MLLWVAQHCPLVAIVVVVTGTKEAPLNNVSFVPLLIIITLYIHTLLAGTFIIHSLHLLYIHTRAQSGLHRSGPGRGEDLRHTEREPRDHLHHHGGGRGHDGLIPLDRPQFREQQERIRVQL